MLYMDTSAAAKLYVTETGSREIESLTERHASRVFTSLVTYAEVLSVLARSFREKRLSAAHFRAQKRRFLAHWDALHVVGPSQQLLAPAERLIERHGLRGFDAIQLCSALWIGNPLFACFDVRLRSAAVAEGLVAVP